MCYLRKALYSRWERFVSRSFSRQKSRSLRFTRVIRCRENCREPPEPTGTEPAVTEQVPWRGERGIYIYYAFNNTENHRTIFWPPFCPQAAVPLVPIRWLKSPLSASFWGRWLPVQSGLRLSASSEPVPVAASVIHTQTHDYAELRSDHRYSHILLFVPLLLSASAATVLDPLALIGTVDKQ